MRSDSVIYVKGGKAVTREKIELNKQDSVSVGASSVSAAHGSVVRNEITLLTSGLEFA